jgi:hypothetical protein
MFQKVQGNADFHCFPRPLLLLEIKRGICASIWASTSRPIFNPLNWRRRASFVCDQPRAARNLRICGPTRLAGNFVRRGLPFVIRQNATREKSKHFNSRASEKFEIVFAYTSYRQKR